jgi:MFS family permease
MKEQHPWRIPAVFAVSFFVHYLDRNLVSLALPEIARQGAWTVQQTASYGELLLGAFFLVYGAAQLLLAEPAERFGAKKSLMLVIIGFSAVTMAFGAVGLALGAGSIALLIALRALLGLAESVHVPMMSAITAQYFPQMLRARANSTWSVGLIVATALGPVIAVPIIAQHGWAMAFILIGGAGLAIALPAVWFAVPRDGASQSRQAGVFKPHANYWLYVVCGVLNAFCAFGILGWLPTYFVKAKNLDFAQLGWPLAVVFTAGVIGTLLLAWIGDKVGRRVRLAAVGFAAASGLCFMATQSTALMPLVALFASAVFAQSAFTAQEYATVQRLSGDTQVGRATGLYNGISLIAGGVGGSLVPAMIVKATGSFDQALMSVVIGAVLACIACTVLSLRMEKSA